MRTTWKGSRGILYVIGATLSALACGGDGGPGIQPTCPSAEKPIAAISVTTAAASLESFGATTQITASAKAADGSACSGVTFSYSSSAPDIAAVNASGVVTAVANGSASIVASAGGQSGSVSVQVAQKVASVSVQAPTGALDALGATMQLTAVGRDAKENVVAGASFAWSSSAANVTTVDANGLVTAVGNGDAKISASADGKSGSADIKVAQRIASISVAPGADTLEALGATVQLNAVAKDANGNIINGPALTWSSSAASVVAVSASGVASAVSNGAATVSAIAGPVSGGVNLLVAQRVASVGISPADATLAPGATQQFSAEAQDANGNPVAVKFLWVSSNHNVAVIDQTGVATGVNGGSVSITAAGGGVPANAALTVSAAPPPSATQLAFTVQPTNAMVRAALTPAIEVEVRDAQGNRVTSARNTVRLIIGNNAGGGNLSGTNAVNAVNGIASFPGLRLDQPGTGYTLVAIADELTNATSATFDIAPRPAAAKVAFSVQPSDVHTNHAISPAVQVEVRDAAGAIVRSSRVAVTLAIRDNPGDGRLLGTTTVNAVNGIASFTGLAIDQQGAGYTLSASSEGLDGVSSSAFIVSPILTLSRSSVSYSGVVGGPNPTTISLAVRSSGGTSDGLEASIVYGTGEPTGWLSATLNRSNATPDVPASLPLRPTIGTLAGGTYHATVTVTSTTPGVSAQVVTIVLTISPPTLAVDKSSVTFTAGLSGPDPAAQVVAVSSPNGTASGLGASVSYPAGQASGWLNVAVLSQTVTPANLTLQPRQVGLAVGNYSATVTISSTTPGVAAKAVAITLSVVSLTFGPAGDFTGSNILNPNFLYGHKVNVSQAITLTHLALVSRTAGQQVKIALYTDGGVRPGTLITQSASTTTVGSVEIPVTTQPLAAGDYWIMIVLQSQATLASRIAAGSQVVSHTFANPIPDPFPTTSNANNVLFNFYIRGSP
jgi:hypothetical protein